MDISSYDHNERSALSEIHSWSAVADFSPSTFEDSGFLSRIRHIGQFKSLLSGLHSANRWGGLLAELDGLRDEDVECLSQAIVRYVAWYRTVFPDVSVPIPIVDFMSQYLACTKIRGIANVSRVLEFGSGLGVIAFILHEDKSTINFDFVEITQSLFILQAHILSFCYGARFRNHALTTSGLAKLGGLQNDHRGIGIEIPRRFRYNLYPWWLVDVPLSGQYDVIMSNSNLAEMSPASLNYYLRNWQNTLAADGHILVQDLGSQINDSYKNVLEAIDRAGFRGLARVTGKQHGRMFMGENLILIGKDHPDFGQARPVSEKPFANTDHATVRRVYGFDRPKGATYSMRDILGRVAAGVRRAKTG